MTFCVCYVKPLQETQLSLTHRATHSCRRNGVVDLKMTLPICVTMLNLVLR